MLTLNAAEIYELYNKNFVILKRKTPTEMLVIKMFVSAGVWL